VVAAPESLYEDLVSAIDVFAADFDDPTHQAALLATFKQGFLEMARVFTVADLKSKAQQIRLEASLKAVT
jgi:hypothetical protein